MLKDIKVHLTIIRKRNRFGIRVANILRICTKKSEKRKRERQEIDRQRDRQTDRQNE